MKSEHKKIENDRIFKVLAVNNSFDKAKVSDLLDKASEWLGKGFSEQNKFIERVVDKLGDIDEDAIVKLADENPNATDGDARNRTNQTSTILGTTLGLDDGTLKGFLPGHGLEAKNVTGNLHKDFPDSGTVASPELPGNMCLVVTGGADISKLRVRLVGYDTKRNIKEGKPINALSTGEVSTLAEAVEQFAEEGVRVRKDGDKLADNKEKLVKQAERLSKLDFDFKKYKHKVENSKVSSHETDEDDTDNNKAGRDGSKTIRKAITNLNSFTGDFQVRYTGYAVNVAKTTLDLCELSLKAYDASKN